VTETPDAWSTTDQRADAGADECSLALVVAAGRLADQKPGDSARDSADGGAGGCIVDLRSPGQRVGWRLAGGKRGRAENDCNLSHIIPPYDGPRGRGATVKKHGRLVPHNKGENATGSDLRRRTLARP
jgi:hypothetical protein